MKSAIIIFLILAAATVSFAFYPFDLGMHMGMSTGGTITSAFAFKDTGGIAFKDTGGIAFKDY